MNQDLSQPIQEWGAKEVQTGCKHQGRTHEGQDDLEERAPPHKIYYTTLRVACSNRLKSVQPLLVREYSLPLTPSVERRILLRTDPVDANFSVLIMNLLNRRHALKMFTASTAGIASGMPLWGSARYFQQAPSRHRRIPSALG